MPQSYYTEFFNATILQWQHLLKDDHCKEIIRDSLEWLVNNKRCSVYAFVIMPNHIHLLWKIADGFEREEVQGALLSFTAHAFKKYLKKHNPELMEQHYVQDADRNYQLSSYSRSSAGRPGTKDKNLSVKGVAGNNYDYRLQN